MHRLLIGSITMPGRNNDTLIKYILNDFIAANFRSKGYYFYNTFTIVQYFFYLF